jgi:hypothetical protein
MRCTAALTVVALLVGASVACLGADRQQGDTQGLVVGIDKVKGEKGDTISVVILSRGMSRLTFLVASQDRALYDTASRLKANDSVHIWWWSEGGTKKWVSRIDLGAAK